MCKAHLRLRLLLLLSDALLASTVLIRVFDVHNFKKPTFELDETFPRFRVVFDRNLRHLSSDRMCDSMRDIEHSRGYFDHSTWSTFRLAAFEHVEHQPPQYW